jgi:hypothetical protein
VTETVDAKAPSAPTALTGRIGHRSIRLSWHASHDNVGVDHYVVYLNGTEIERVRGTHARVPWRRLRRHGASRFTVRAFDAAGHWSRPSGAFEVLVFDAT